MSFCFYFSSAGPSNALRQYFPPFSEKGEMAKEAARSLHTKTSKKKL